MEATGLETLTSAISALMGMVGDMLNTILANPVLALLFAGGIIGMVIGIVKKLKRV